jgi:hypothetical protein
MQPFCCAWRVCYPNMLPGSLAPLKAVVVDDDPMIRVVVGRCLTHFGATATLCENANLRNSSRTGNPAASYPS